MARRGQFGSRSEMAEGCTRPRLMAWMRKYDIQNRSTKVSTSCANTGISMDFINMGPSTHLVYDTGARAMSASLGKSVVTFGLAFLAGVVGACIGWLVTGFAADAILSVGGMSDINGGRAMVAFFTFAPFGALAGLILGVWLAVRKRTGNWSFAPVAGYSAFVVLLCVGIGAVYVGYLYLSDDILVHNGPSPILRFEIRLPAT